MKMPDLSRHVAGTLALALFCCPCGCSPSVETPSSNVFATAMADYEAGNYDAAIAGFEQVLKSNPKDYKTHLQLAVALQDQNKDYERALAHYRIYLDLRPEDDKTTHAADRMRECKDKLVEEYAGKTVNAFGKNGSADENKKLAAENARLKDKVKKLENGNRRLSATLRKVEPCLDIVDKKHAANLRAEVKKVLAEASVPETKEKPRRVINPSDTQLLDDESGEGLLASQDVKDEIAQAKAEDDSGQPPPIKKGAQHIVDHSTGPDLKPVPDAVQSGGKNVVMGGGKKPSGPARPDMYKVQPKDTLQGIAFRFYGSRGKWRDIQKANADKIPITGAVREGQIIKLP